ncbi:TLD-domain-containing protein [Mycena floridula]|nr:TLD-domain-containing protein [Mycena floridula]
MHPIDAIPSLVPLPASRPDKNVEPDVLPDAFSTLFSPPTPRASPTIPSLALDMQTISPVAHEQHDLLRSADSEFGSFVSAGDDPLSVSAPLAAPDSSSREFFDKFVHDAAVASARNKHVVDEILLHENDPLYWLKDDTEDHDPSDSLSDSLSDLDLNFFTAKSTHSRSSTRSPSLPLPSLVLEPVASTSSVSSSPPDPDRPVPSRTTSYQTLSKISSRWMSSVIPPGPPTHTRVGSLDTLFDDQSSRRPTISHSTPFASTNTPFAPRVYIPPTGAPGFAGDSYDWDKGYSTELDKELQSNPSHSSASRGLGLSLSGEAPVAGIGNLIDKKSGTVELKGRKEMTTPVLDSLIAELIRAHLPALARLPRSWSLLYSLDQHGISLNTLYARCDIVPKPGAIGRNGIVLVIKDANDAIFGAFNGEGLRLSKGKGYYGSGESFLWKHDKGKLQVFKWTGRNEYVALCEPEFLSFGGGDGHYGLYLDDTLLDGSSAPCPTFNNEPLCSTGPKKGGSVAFECVGLEVWGIGG